MKRGLILFIFLYYTTCLFGQRQQDSLFHLLDNIITNRIQYAKEKENRLDSLKRILNINMSMQRNFELYNLLFNEYKHYNLDSALWAAKNKVAIASQLNDKQMNYESEMNIAEMLGKMGMYKETFDIMGRIHKSDLDKKLWGSYFHIYHSIYSLLLENALSEQEQLHYRGLVTRYKDSLLLINDANSITYKLILNGKLIEAGKYTQALALMLQCYHSTSKDAPEASSVSFGISEIYEKTGEVLLQKKFLVISAVTDIRRAVKSYIALRKLAVILYSEGDVERAYQYMKCAMEDATFAKARFRMIKISEALPIITATYDKKMKEEKAALVKYLILISVLSMILFFCVVFIYKQLKKISAARQLVNKKNTELVATNELLNGLNKKLSEADHVKETYIGYALNLCSTYIDKLENYRVSLNKELKSRHFDEALKITGNGNLVTNEVKEFFQNFDAVFLNLYPNFIDEFNEMLKEGEQIIPKSDDILTPELRIFALVRLGISDSSKIAEFLHYSPQTVYNYKLKVKNKLTVSKDEFYIKIQQIGL